MERNDISTEEERSTLLRLFQEIGGKESNPLENGETGARLEHKHGDSLLNDQSNDNSGPIEPSEMALRLNSKKDRRTKGSSIDACSRGKSTPGRRKVRGQRWHGHRRWNPIMNSHSINVLYNDALHG